MNITGSSVSINEISPLEAEFNSSSPRHFGVPAFDIFPKGVMTPANPQKQMVFDSRAYSSSSSALARSHSSNNVVRPATHKKTSTKGSEVTGVPTSGKKKPKTKTSADSSRKQSVSNTTASRDSRSQRSGNLPQSQSRSKEKAAGAPSTMRMRTEVSTSTERSRLGDHVVGNPTPTGCVS